MKKVMIFWIFLVFFIVSACNGTEQQNFLQEDWTTIEEVAENTKVRIFMWGGDEGVNQYIAQYVAPLMNEKHGINLVRTPMDINEVLQKLLTEKNANIENGTIDIIWINGENFYNAKTNDLLLGAFTPLLPNFQQYIDETLYQYDFGTAVDHLEAPWGRVQFVFHYDSEKVSVPPKTVEELAEWVRENRGKFTYPDANDFTGNAFLRHLLYEFLEEELLLGDRFDEQALNQASIQMWGYLNEIKPYLWRNGETYPQSLAQLDQLFSQGEVYMTMGFNEARAESLIESGVFPASTKSFILDVGSIGSTHYLSVPFNSPNQAGALVTINELLSPDAQRMKMAPSMWGENTVLSMNLLTEQQEKQFQEVDRGESVLPSETFDDTMLQELSSEYIEWLKEKWFSEVIQN